MPLKLNRTLKICCDTLLTRNNFLTVLGHFCLFWQVGLERRLACMTSMGNVVNVLEELIKGL